MVDRLADPLLSGIYGGEAASLVCGPSSHASMPCMDSHGSLGRAMLAAQIKMSQVSKKPVQPLFTSLKDGLSPQAKPAALTRKSMLLCRPQIWKLSMP